MEYTIEPRPPRLTDLLGQSFGYWTVLLYAFRTPRRRYYWLCRCICGIERPVDASALTGGASKSCGCRKIEAFIKSATRHGQSYHPLYHIWRNMLHRCYDPKEIGYKNYGERGIRVCDRWRYGSPTQYGIECFIADMGERPTGMTLERQDNDGNYCPENCCWADMTTQHNNRRDNVFLTFNNETLTIAQWANRIGCQAQRLRHRIKRGWSAERVLFAPLHANRGRVYRSENL